MLGPFRVGVMARSSRAKEGFGIAHRLSVGGAGTPTSGGPDHRAESVRFCAAFPDNKVKHPHDVVFGDGDYTAFVTRFTGTSPGR